MVSSPVGFESWMSIFLCSPSNNEMGGTQNVAGPGRVPVSFEALSNWEAMQRGAFSMHEIRCLEWGHVTKAFQELMECVLLEEHC